MKSFRVIILMFFAVLCLCACSSAKGVILFHTQPITRGNALSGTKTFQEGQRVYYLFIAPQKMKNEFIRVQVYKLTNFTPNDKNEVYRTKDYRLMLDERYYHSDYFTLYGKGRYVMQIFSHDNFETPIAVNDFYVQ